MNNDLTSSNYDQDDKLPNKPGPLTAQEQELYNTATQIARNMFEKHGEASPVLLAINPHSGEIGGSPMAGISKAESSALIARLKMLAPVALIIEAWMTRYTVKEDSAISQAIRSGQDAVIPEPRTSPNRQEMLIVQFYHKDRRILASAEITRDKDRKPTLAPDWEVADNTVNTMRPANFGDASKQHLASGDVR